MPYWIDKQCTSCSCTANSSTFAIEKQPGLKPHGVVNLISHMQLCTGTVYTAAQGWFSRLSGCCIGAWICCIHITPCTTPLVRLITTFAYVTLLECCADFCMGIQHSCPNRGGKQWEPLFTTVSKAMQVTEGLSFVHNSTFYNQEVDTVKSG